ncbi:MAG: hypothetical protein HPY55_02820 [Firmicutes bacterium]|nr:hypothetical protein [Bacillota bacterium]
MLTKAAVYHVRRNLKEAVLIRGNLPGLRVLLERAPRASSQRAAYKEGLRPPWGIQDRGGMACPPTAAVSLTMRVRDIMNIPGLKEHLTLVAGASALDRVITNVTVMEAPDLPEHLSGNELVLTTLYSMRDDETLRVRLIMRLAERQAAAVIVKVGRFVESVPPEMVNQADHLGLPILTVPSQVVFREIIYKVVGDLIRESSVDSSALQAETRGPGPQLSQRLWQKLLGNDSLSSFCEDLAAELRAPCWVVSARGDVLASSTEMSRAVENALKGTLASAIPQISPFRAGSCLVWPCQVLRERMACLVVESPAGIEPALDLLVKQTAAAIAFNLLQNQRMVRAAGPELTETFEGILFGHLNDDAVLYKLKTFSYELQAHTYVSVINFELQDEPRHMWVTRLLGVLQETLPRSLSCVRGSELITLITSRRPSDLLSRTSRRSLEITLEEISGPARVLSMGVGLPVTSPSALSSSYILAKRAVELGARLAPGRRIHFFEDYALEAYILKGKLSAEGKLLMERFLKPLREYDSSHDSSLIHTLEHVLESGGIEESAAAMHVHPNTIRYRLRKVEELTGLDPLSPKGGFYFRAALILARG